MEHRHVLLEQWSKGLAEVAGTVGRDVFAATLLEAVRRLVDFDFIMTFAYREEDTPLMLGDTLDKARHRVIATDYVSGPFMLDPFFRLVRDGRRAGCFRLHDIAPDHFRRSEYFRMHYGRTGIGEEIGFVFAMAQGFTGITSFARWQTSPPIRRGELAILAAIGPAIAAFCHAQWADAARAPANPKLTGREVAQLGLRLLSAREREIVTLILQGHSTESVALQLDISPGTVKIHRKNIYRKLKVSTQAELFAAYLGFAGGGRGADYSPGDIPRAPELTHAWRK